jgi:hypothetical protein
MSDVRAMRVVKQEEKDLDMRGCALLIAFDCRRTCQHRQRLCVHSLDHVPNRGLKHMH